MSATGARKTSPGVRGASVVRVGCGKKVGADSFVAQAQAGNVLLLKGAWNEERLAESFPDGAQGNLADANSDGFAKLTGRGARQGS